VRNAIDEAIKRTLSRFVANVEKPVVLFMKGTPDQPMCGFSRATIQVLGIQGVDPQKFASYNVLEDDELRSGLLFQRISHDGRD
jgi:monothiol glutaredoxin